MGFFKELDEKMADNSTISLTVTKSSGKLIVMVIPKLETKKEDIKNEIIPLQLKGSSDQLDSGFMLSLSQGLEMIKGLQTNIDLFEASVKKADKKTSKKTSDVKIEVKTKEEPEETNPEDDDKSTENVDTETGEINENKPAVQEPVKTEKKVKPVEPAKSAAKKKDKKEDKSGTALSGEPEKSEEDEW